MEQELAVLLPLWKPALIIMSPSLLVGLMIMLGSYKLVNKWGDRFLNAQDRQAAAFEKIAVGVEKVQADLDANTKLNADIRITLAAMSTRIDQILENTKRGQNA
jgi:hypothetical protein